MTSQFLTRQFLIMLSMISTLLLAGCGSAATPRVSLNSPLSPLQGAANVALPEIDRPWSAADYMNASGQLTRLALVNPPQLPCLDNPETRQIFARMTARENLETMMVQQGTAEQSLVEISQTLTILGEWLDLYSVNRIETQMYDDEIVELSRVSLEYLIAVFNLTIEYLSTLPPEQLRHPERQQGIAQMINGLHTCFVGFLEFFQSPHRERFALSALRRHARNMGQHLPQIVPNLPRELQLSFNERLEQSINQESDLEIGRSLSSLREVLFQRSEQHSSSHPRTL